MNTGTFTTSTWTEHVASGGEGAPRYAHARATFAYTGVIDGTSTCDYLLYYPGEGFTDGGQASPGIERIEGTVAGRTGSFVVRHDVRYGADGIDDTWAVVPGSGTGDLAGITGHGTSKGDTATIGYTFDYRFD
ncbi:MULTISPECIES: DUF3224 domain-containing protein [Prauserella salsuginis group]|uniref:DUF3224 domain-containing protein n=2 Tax=Prauserella salsuginis group TaxID=2893672 RepID=A0A839XH60_9PSEU|nr:MULTISPECIES: DUF3224 domain-containing protein [Prauserella salsuginis group]MBB3661817.1 hypothetical protein [Prauserella sediminis]MCR3722806.1 Protein of unknown function (DUF3224) [Prauserella flava]MCR3737139.1 Protein of unknown function (DUF3224) [Prauserella salsuginis]